MLYRNLILGLLILGMFAFRAFAQDDRWDGADDLEVNPLACPGDDVAFNFETPAYDGGEAEDPPDRAGEDILLVDVPRQIGNAYFRATSQGMQEAARELGNVEVVTDAPPSAGTIFWRHRQSGLCVAPFDAPFTTDISGFELALSVENRFNRAVLFRENIWHRVEHGFGEGKAARLTQTLFFEVED